MSADIGEALAAVTEEAARLILPLFRSGLDVVRKADESPVTVADQRAETLILERLAKLFPEIETVSEEHASEHGVPRAIPPRFFLVDPLDGTKAFIRGAEHFTVNIALVENGAPTAGAVCQPVSGEVWFTANAGAMKRFSGETGARPVRVRSWPEGEAVALLSHTLKDEQERNLRERYGYARNERMDSSVKFCRIAEGAADIYPRHGPTMEWDTAAGHAVLQAAGGSVSTIDGAPLSYGRVKDGFLNPSFVARGGS